MVVVYGRPVDTEQFSLCNAEIQSYIIGNALRYRENEICLKERSEATQVIIIGAKLAVSFVVLKGIRS